MIGAAVGGLAGAIWADRNNDGMVDGYVYNGQYYHGWPGRRSDAGPGSDLFGADPEWRTRLKREAKYRRTGEKFA